MSKKFHAENRETGERWRPDFKGQCLVLFDSGELAVVDNNFPAFMKPLDPHVWKVVTHNSLKTR